MIVLNKPIEESNVDAFFWIPNADAAKKLENELSTPAPSWTRSAKVTVFLLSALLIVVSLICAAAIYLASYYGTIMVQNSLDVSSDNESIYMYYQNDTYDFTSELFHFCLLNS